MKATFTASKVHPDDGAHPYATVIFDSLGNLYGAAPYGGSDNGGAVFALMLAGGSWTYSPVYSFPGGGGGVGPYGNLVFDHSGNLYGTTAETGQAGRGQVCELSQAGGEWTINFLWTCSGGDDGGTPFAGVSLDAQSGQSVRNNPIGGTDNEGVVFEIQDQ